MERLLISKMGLKKIQRTGTPKEILIATTILNYHDRKSSMKPVLDVLLSQKELSDKEIPTQIAVDACFLLNAYPQQEIATLVSQNIHRPLWLNPCLPLLVEFSLQDSSIWTVLTREMASFPNDNDIRKHLARKGSAATILLFQKLKNAKTVKEVDILSSIIWGLIPPEPLPTLSKDLKSSQRLGAKRVGSIEHQKELNRAYQVAIDGLIQRVQAPKDARVFTQAYKFDLGRGLLKSLCR